MLLVSLSIVLSGSAFAQAAAAATEPSPAAAVASPTSSGTAVQAVCKDGTLFTGEKLKGACKGHGGIDKKAPAAKSSAAAAEKSTTVTKTSPVAQAAGGGADKVWGNDSTKVYHCPGDKYYGKTKKGEYMTEVDAKTRGFHADHGKACAAR